MNEDEFEYATKKYVKEQADNAGCVYFLLALLVFGVLGWGSCDVRSHVRQLTERVEKLERDR